MTNIRIHQLRIGTVRQIDGWRSAIFKEPVDHPLWLSTTGLVGDAVGDTRHHGGPEQAVLVYAEAHYAEWKAEGFTEQRGAFGENLLVSGLTDQEACIGDTFEAGEARLQIASPRVPCNTLVRRHGRPDILTRVFETARGGWYCRVLREGHLAAGQELRLLDRPHPEWTVARALQARWRMAKDNTEAHALAQVTALDPSWKARLLG